MTVNYTTLLSLGQPVTGTESGTWGDDVNNAVTSYLDIAIAGTLTLTGDGSVTLANTFGSSTATNIGATTAQYYLIKVVGPLTVTKVITAPSLSKTYLVNNTDSTYGVTVKASGQTGVTVPAGVRALVAFNGTDYELVARSDAVTPTSGQILAADGSAAAPAYSFASSGNSDNGMYLSAANTLGFSTAGTARLTIDGSGNFSATTDAFTVSRISNSTTAETLVIKDNVFPGYNTLSLAPTRIWATTSSNFANSNLSLGVTSFKKAIFIGGDGKVLIGDTGAAVASYQLELATGQFAGPNGTASAPTYSFASSGNANTGVYLSASDELSISTDGVKRFTVTSTGSVSVASLTASQPVFTDASKNLVSVASVPVANGGTGLTSGTSGGIPYFSGPTTIASSAVLVSNALVVGGGAGVAPQTITTGVGVTAALGVGVGNAGAFVTNGGALGTPSSGTLTNATGLPLSTGVTGTLSIAKGGTGQTTAQAAINSLAGAVTSGQYLRGDGTNVVMSVIQAGDVPTLNQNTTGTASNVTGTVAIANGGTGATTASTARTNLGSTAVGDNLFTLTNPSAIRFIRINADNTVSTLTDSQFRTAIGAGTGNGTVLSVDITTGVTGLTATGGPITGTGTIAIGGTLAIGSGGTGATTAPVARTNLGLGTMSTQNANSVAITGGTIEASGSISGKGGAVGHYVDLYSGTDTQKIQAAIDAAKDGTNGSNVVIFGAKTYTITGTINIGLTNSQSVELRGMAPGINLADTSQKQGTVIIFDSATNDAIAFHVQGSQGTGATENKATFTARDLIITADQTGPGTGQIGLQLGNTGEYWNPFSKIILDNVQCSKFTGAGFKVVNTHRVAMSKCIAFTPGDGGSAIGIYILATGGYFCGGVIMDTCEFTAGGATGTTERAVKIEATGTNSNCAGNMFNNTVCYFGEVGIELYANAGGILADTFMNNVQVDGYQPGGDADPNLDYALYIHTDSNASTVLSDVTVGNSYFVGYNLHGIYVEGTSNSPIKNCSFRGNQIKWNDSHGMKFVECRGLNVVGNTFNNNGTTTGVSGDANIYISLCQYFSVAHNVGLNLPPSTTNGYGVYLPSNYSDQFSVVNNSMVAQYAAVGDNSTGGNKTVSANYS